MNVERIEDLARRIAALPHSTKMPPTAHLSFNMRAWFQGCVVLDPSGNSYLCGTSMCMAGLVVHEVLGVAIGEPLRINGEIATYTKTAGDYLGLDKDTATELFSPTAIGPSEADEPVSYAEVMPARAARVLRALARTGRVDWSIQ